jgi:hypothetical protein
MRRINYLAGCALAIGVLAVGIPTASAQDWRFQRQYQGQYGNPYYSQDNRDGYSNAYGHSNTYDHIEELQEHIAHDRAKLNEAISCGNDAEAARQAADLARDQRALRELQHRQDAPSYNAPTYNRGWNFRFGWR